MPITFLTPRRQPVLVLQDGDDDLGDAERGDGEVVGPQAKGRLADDPGRAGRQKPAHGPGEEDRQAEAAEIAGGGGVDRLDRDDAGVEDAAEERRSRRSGRRSSRGCARRPGTIRLQIRMAATMVMAPRMRPSRTRRPPAAQASVTGGIETRTARKAAQRHEAHDPDVEEAGIAPLHVHAERHDRADEPHVEDGQRDVPATVEAGDPIRPKTRAKRRRFFVVSERPLVIPISP